MKHSIITFMITLAFCATSCMDTQEISPGLLPNGPGDPNDLSETTDFEPIPAGDLVIVNLNSSNTFDHQNEFEQLIDIDQDGDHEFMMYGYSLEDGIDGFLHIVAIYGIGASSIAYNSPVSVSCNEDIMINPIHSMQHNQSVGSNLYWENICVMYVNSDYESCNSYMNFTNMGQTNYIGIMIDIDGENHYGWLEMELSGESRIGFPGCSSTWKVKRFGYSPNSNQTVRIPA